MPLRPPIGHGHDDALGAIAVPSIIAFGLIALVLVGTALGAAWRGPSTTTRADEASVPRGCFIRGAA